MQRFCVQKGRAALLSLAIQRKSQCTMLLAMMSSFSAHALEVANIELHQDRPTENITQLYKISPLSPAIMARMTQAKGYTVVDSQGKSMPLYHQAQHVLQSTQHVPVSIYNWANKPTRTRLEEQRKSQHNTKVTVLMAGTEIDFSASPSHAINKQSKMHERSSKEWLVVMPTAELSASRGNDMTAQFTWAEPNQKVKAHIAVSDDLRAWQQVKDTVFVSMNADVGSQHQTQLTHNSVAGLPSQYAYWRITLNKPMTLQSIKVTQSIEQVETTRLPLVFEPVDANTWQATLAHAWSLQSLGFDVPVGQVWQFDVAKEVTSQDGLKTYWQTMSKANLYHVDANDKQNSIAWDTPQRITTLQLKGQIPIKGAVTAKVSVPKQTLLFLAQGTPPYALKMAQTDLEWKQLSHVELPQKFVKQKALPASLQQVDTLKQEQPTYTRWALWLALLGVMGVLMYLAARLVKGLESSEK